MTVTRRKGGRIGVPKGTYEVLCQRYGEICWICAAPPKTRRLHIDHDHKTLRVRGLLCFNCNRRLPKGLTPMWLRAAAAYLELPPEPPRPEDSPFTTPKITEVGAPGYGTDEERPA